MLKTIIIAASVAISGAAFAQSQVNQGPTDATVQSAPNGTQTVAPQAQPMQDRPVAMPTAPANEQKAPTTNPNGTAATAPSK